MLRNFRNWNFSGRFMQAVLLQNQAVISKKMHLFRPK